MPTSRPYVEDLYHSNPFCPPDWRWQQSQKDVDQNLPTQDQTLIRLRKHLGRPESLPSDDEHIARALVIHAAATDQKAELEARLLTGIGFAGIAQIMNLPVAVVMLYGDIFFDVAAQLHAKDWIAVEALRIGPEYSEEPDEAALWRQMGWAYPAALEILIADYRQTASSAQREKAAKLRLHLRFHFTGLGHPSYPGICRALAAQLAADPDASVRASMPHLRRIQKLSESLQQPRDRSPTQRTDASQGSPTRSRRRPSQKQRASQGANP